MEMKQTHKPFTEKTNDTLYKIGMFAAMNHVTVKALRFYEDQGLLIPALIHPDTGTTPSPRWRWSTRSPH